MTGAFPHFVEKQRATDHRPYFPAVPELGTALGQDTEEPGWGPAVCGICPEEGPLGCTLPLPLGTGAGVGVGQQCLSGSGCSVPVLGVDLSSSLGWAPVTVAALSQRQLSASRRGEDAAEDAAGRG